MARVIRYMDGLNHLESHATTTLETLCGICDDRDNSCVGDVFEGVVTCDDCRSVAIKVFESCKKSEVTDRRGK